MESPHPHHPYQALHAAHTAVIEDAAHTVVEEAGHTAAEDAAQADTHCETEHDTPLDTDTPPDTNTPLIFRLICLLPILLLILCRVHRLG